MTAAPSVVGDYLWDVVYAREVDRLTSERYFIGSDVLMESAGRGLADAVIATEPDDAPILVLAGPGHNGGDALVAARHLAEAGYDVHVVLVPKAPGAPLGDGAERQAKILRAIGHTLTVYKQGALRPYYEREPLIIDGVLGLGFKGPLAEDSLLYRALLEASSIPDRTVFAVDVPSGLDADRGDVQQVPLTADVTVTFGGLKPCHALAPARDHCGEVLTLSIGLPQAAQDAALVAHKPAFLRPDPQALIAENPWERLARSAHKFDRGHVLIIGGSDGKTGAPILAAMATLRAGAGWASIAMPDSATLSLRGDVPREITFEPLFDGEQLNALKLARFLEERKVRAVVLGPGSVRSPLTPEVAAELAEYSGFVVLDAGATQGLGDLLPSLDLDPSRWVATPHPGEWLRIGERLAQAIPLTRSGVKRANAEADRLGISLLYKGATPVLLTGLVNGEDSPALVATEGSNVLARAGSGDVLAGVIAAHGAIGLTTAVAVLRSQVLVAYAAELAAEKRGRHGVVARDVVAELGRAGELAMAEEDETEDDEGEESPDDHHQDHPKRRRRRGHR